MKTLSVLLTLALFVAANGLAVRMKHDAVQPAPRKDMARVSKTTFYHATHATNGSTARMPIYE